LLPRVVTLSVFSRDAELGSTVTLREAGKSPFFLVCDHGGNLLPRRVGTLGLQVDELGSHIALDIGAAAVTQFMADELDAFAVLQTCSRLVIDCNRPPTAEDSIAVCSEFTDIPANRTVTRAEREQRLNETFLPYHARISAELDRRLKNGMPTVLVALHSFTPVFKGHHRPWHVSLLYNRDARLAKPMIDLLRRDGLLVVGDNQPYTVSDDSDYTIPVHGERRGLLHVAIEIRQDLILDEDGQRLWAKRLAETLTLSGKALLT